METQLYDLYVQAYSDSEPDVPAELLAHYDAPAHYWRCGAHLNLSLPKEVAFLIALAIEKKGGLALIYPEQYRHPQVSYEQSKEIVSAYYQKLVEAEPDRYGKIKEMNFNPVCYQYVADDYVLQERGLVPGYKGLRVDKLSGKVLSKEEWADFYKLLYAREDVAHENPIRPR